MRSLFAVVVLLSVMIVGCHKPVDYRSTDGRYRAQFPSAPKEKVETANTEVGPLQLHTTMAEIGAEAFAVTYADYPNALPTRVRLDGVRDGFARGVAGKVVSELLKDLGSCSGRDVNLELPKGRMRLRIYICGQRLYQIVWGGPAGHLFDKRVDTFLDSFHVDSE